MAPLPPDFYIRPSMDVATSLKEALTKRHTTLPLVHIRDWKPFQIDALGLVTLLGADEVNQSVGTLQHRRFTEYLPLLAAFVIAGDRFVAEQPGFVLYNLDDGITSTELKGWFSRWLMSQDVNNATTVLEWHEPKKSKVWEKAIAPALSCVLVIPLLVMTVLVGDWYGVGNAGAIIISIVTRVYLLSKRRHARDKLAIPKEGEPNDMKRLCIIRSDGKMVTCVAPKSVLVTFVNQKPVGHPKYYHGARWICWLALGVHMCILGMCSLFTQIYTVLLLVLSTWWFTSDFFWDIGREKLTPTGDQTSAFNIPFNKEWQVKQINYAEKDAPGSNDRRLYAWARLLLNEKDEDAMFRWNLFPIKDESSKWWVEYQQAKESFRNSKNGKPSGTVNEKSSGTRPAQMSNEPSQPPSTPTPSNRPLVNDASPPADNLDSSLSSTSTQTASDGSSPGDTTMAMPPQTNSSSL
jgi:hypothetical protein